MGPPALFAALSLGAPTRPAFGGEPDRYLTFAAINPILSEDLGDFHVQAERFSTTPFRQAQLSIHNAGACQFGMPYNLYDRSCGGASIFVSPPKCADIDVSQRPTTACVSQRLPATGVGGDGRYRYVSVRSEEEMRNEIKTSASATGSGWGVTASGSMSYITSGQATTRSAVIGIEATGQHVAREEIENAHLLKLSENAKTAFRSGPAGWRAAGYSSFFMRSLYYGGFFTGSYVMNSRTEDRNSAFEAAAQMSGNVWGVDAEAEGGFSSVRSSFSDRVSFQLDLACSPATCLGHQSAITTLADIKDAYTAWWAGMTGDAGSAEAEAILVGLVRDNDEVIQLFDDMRTAGVWTQDDFDGIFYDPNSVLFDSWTKARLERELELNELNALKTLSTTTVPVRHELDQITRSMGQQLARIAAFNGDEFQDQLNRVFDTSVLTQLQDYYTQAVALMVPIGAPLGRGVRPTRYNLYARV